MSEHTVISIQRLDARIRQELHAASSPGKIETMASSSHNHQNTAIKGGMGLTKTPANTASDTGSSFLHGTKAGFHDTHDQNV